MKPTAPKDPALLAQTNIVRLLEANLKVITQDDAALLFRRNLIRQVAAASETMNPGLICRAYEAVCAVEFPKNDVTKLRVKLESVIGGILSFPAPKPAPATPGV
jgi:hypothetical protein